MTKQTKRLLSLVFLLAGAGSFARADVYSISSDWHTGSALFRNLNDYTGNGTFTWDGTNFSNISFSFVDTTTHTTLWTANPTDGEMLFANTLLILGNGTNDCAGPSCIGIDFGFPITLGMGTRFGISGFSQMPNTFFDGATLTDLGRNGGAGSQVPEPGSISLLLTALGIGATVGRKHFQVFQG